MGINRSGAIAASKTGRAMSLLEMSHDINFCGGESFLQIVVADTDSGRLEAAAKVLDIAHALAGAVSHLDIRAREQGGECVPAYKLAAGLELIVGIASCLVAEEIGDKANAEGGN